MLSQVILAVFLQSEPLKMTLVVFSCLVFAICLVAGLVGALTGLGGGVIIVPVLVLIFGCDIHYAAGASLVSVVATSSGAASSYLKSGYSNLRIATFLELATTCGALVGSFLASRLDGRIICIIFGVILALSALSALNKKDKSSGKAVAQQPATQGGLAARLKLSGFCPPDTGGIRKSDFEKAETKLLGGTDQDFLYYQAVRIWPGFALMFIAGILSGLLGIGSGAMKVLALDQVMALPLKVSTTTSNLMIGVTAAASAGVYFRRGYINIVLAAPVVLAVVAGSRFGARLLPRIEARMLRKLLAVVLLLVAVEMILKGIKGAL